MRKRLFSILLVIALVCSVVPMNAFASQTSGSTTVTYYYSPEYSINIPASISVNDTDMFTFVAGKMDIGSGKRVNVIIDGQSTYENGGNFYLYKDKGTPSEAKIPCTIMRGNPSGSIGWQGITGLSEVVAWFENGNTDPKGYGAIKFRPEVAGDTPYGTYTGTVHFKIELVD